VTATIGLSVLAVDDEPPALDEVAYLVRRSPVVDEVVPVGGAVGAVRRLQERRFDVVLLDIALPGLSGLELASVLSRFADPPAVVFVTAHEEHALEAFDVGAVGYLLKPIDEERLLAVLDRVAARRQDPATPPDTLESVPVELAGRTVMIARGDVDWVESAGDYVRLHTHDGRGYLVRQPLSRLEEAWSNEGFARIHRQYLVCLRAVTELRTDAGQTVVRLGERELPVSRRQLRELRDRLVRHATRPSR
jgi:DNA-binding LytR/AlgR family response regulator